MAKRPKTTHARAKRLRTSYVERLALLRKASSAFDAAKWDTLYLKRPLSKRGKADKRRALSQLNGTYRKLARFVNRDFKFVRPKSKKNFETLRQYVGAPKLKGLRAIPVPTQAKRLTVRFDRKGRPTLREDGVDQKLFLFPHTPRPHVVQGPLGTGKYQDAQDDAIAMLRDMLPEMPDGFYIFMSRHHFLIPEIHERDRLEAQVRAFYSNYNNSPEFLSNFLGFKWLSDSDQDIFRIRKEMSSERERNKAIRKRARVAKALKQVLAMDKQFKRGKLSKRARATGRR